MVVNGAVSTWWPVSSCGPWRSVLEPALFNIFTHDLVEGNKSSLANLQMISGWQGVLMCWRVGGLRSRTGTDWIGGSDRAV